MNKYQAHIFGNGRIALIEEKDYSDALEQEKEILVFCGGWSGGYARAFGANREPDYYNINSGNDCFSCYAYDVKDETFTYEQLAKFYRVIVTDGIKVYMKTGEPATSYFGSTFSDWDTKYKDFIQRSFGENKNITEEEFEKLRHQINVEKTLNMVCGNKEEQEEIRSAIKGFLH